MNKLLFTLSLVVLVAGEILGAYYGNPVDDFQKTKDEMLDKFKNQCKSHTRSDMAFTNIMRKLNETMDTCLIPIMMQLGNKLSYEMSNPHNPENMKKIFHEFCAKNQDLYKCLDPVIKLTNTCLEPPQIKNKDTVVRILKRINNMSCNNDGQQASNFIKNGVYCVQGMSMEFMECVQDIMPRYVNTVTGEFKGQNVTDKVICEDLKNSRHCIGSKLQTCSDKSAFNLFNNAVQIVMEEKGCISPNGSNSMYGNISLLMTILIAKIFIF